MNLNESFDVSPGKVEALLARIKRLNIDPSAIEESFIRGGGKGGQKINKTANCVQLRYAPLELVVRCQKERRRTVNRFLALRELVDRVEMKVSPGTSKRLRGVRAPAAQQAPQGTPSCREVRLKSSGHSGLNREPPGPKPGALPIELCPVFSILQ